MSTLFENLDEARAGIRLYGIAPPKLASTAVRTLEFMKWLGIAFPRWLENELRHSTDTLERSVDLCESVFTAVQDYAREKRLPIGINVESVSIRRSEIDASVELFRRLSSHLGR